MGAQSFEQTGKGKTAQEAFSQAVEEAAYEHGHGGYTGTLAEKHEFNLITPRAGEAPEDCVDRLEADYGQTPGVWNPYADKWGPAGCIKTGDNEWLFFGSASS